MSGVRVPPRPRRLRVLKIASTPPPTPAVSPRSAVTLEGLLHGRDHLGLVLRDRHELGDCGERHVAHPDHHGELPAALALDVTGEGVTKQDYLPRHRRAGS